MAVRSNKVIEKNSGDSQRARVKAVFLHEPLVRAIGSFTKIAFSYQEAAALLQTQTRKLFLRDFNTFCDGCSCMKVGKRGCCDLELELTPDLEHTLTHKEILEYYKESKDDMFKEKIYPGLCLYFLILKELYDACLKEEVYMIACPENIHSAEYLSFIGPSLILQMLENQLSDSTVKYLNELLKCYSQLNISPDLRDPRNYAQIIQLINLLNLTDAKVLTYLLLDGQYTTPLEVRRYRGKNANRQQFHTETGLDTNPTQVLETIFPSDKYKLI